MRYFAKGNTPAHLRPLAQAWQREYTSDPSILGGPRAARTRFDAPDHDKQATRDKILTEQDGICAFCMGRINRESPRIDKNTGTVLAHIVPIGSDPRHAFCWTNLVGACTGGSGTALHCDVLQGNRKLFVNPALNPGIENYIRYSDRGELRYKGPSLCGRTPEEIQDEFDVVLGLNIDRLKRNRATVLEVAKKRMLAKGWSIAALEREIDHWSTVTESGYTVYFYVAVEYLRRKLAAHPGQPRKS